jgi:hypothetical protein
VASHNDYNNERGENTSTKRHNRFVTCVQAWMGKAARELLHYWWPPKQTKVYKVLNKEENSALEDVEEWGV